MSTLSTQDDVRTAYKAGEATVEMTVTTNTSNLNIRNLPSKEGKVLVSIPKGSTVHAFDSASTVSGWRAIYYVNSQNLKVFGFCSSDYLSGSTSAKAEAATAKTEDTASDATATSEDKNIYGGGNVNGGTSASASW